MPRPKAEQSKEQEDNTRSTRNDSDEMSDDDRSILGGENESEDESDGEDDVPDAGA